MNQQQRASAPIGLMDQIQVGLIGLYVAIAGIFWIGDISPALLANLKLALFGLLVLIGLGQHQPFTRAMTYLLSWLAVCSVFAFATTLANADLAEATDSARSFAEPAFWMVALAGVRPAAYQALFHTLAITLTMFFLVALYPVAAAAGIAPITYPPAGFADQAEITNLDAFQQSISVVAGGFNGLRTGWGVSVALSASLALALYMRNTPVSGWRVILAIIVIFGSMASIVVTGARGGSAALLLISLYGLLYRFPLSRYHRLVIVFFMIFAALLVFIVDYTLIVPENFFRGFGAGGSAFDALNAATTGRLDTWIVALELFVSSPFYGVGREGSLIMISGEILRPHNVWLRLLAESGLTLIIPVLAVTAQMLRLALPGREQRRLVASGGARMPDTSLVLLCGLVIALAEPSVIFGSMNTNIAFWTALWILIARPHEVPLVTRTGIADDRPPTRPAAPLRAGN